MSRPAGAALRNLNLAAKGLLLLLLLHAVVFPDLPQYQGKGIGARLLTYPTPVWLVPLVWWLTRGRRRAGAVYPHLIDLCVVLPFLIDTAGNTANLYDTITWWDDAMHFVTWVPWVAAFGLGLRRWAPQLGRLNTGALTVGFGAVTHILWEVAEYLSFVRGNPTESATAYQDTIGDLVLSLCGSFTGGILVGTVLYHLAGGSAEVL